jgi:membrane protease YdiL (CAAX protease family)
VAPNPKSILLGSSILLLPFTLAAFQLTTRLLGPRPGYLAGLVLYWAYALAAAAWLGRGREGYLRELLKPGALTRPRVFWSASCFIPACAVFFIAFLPNVASLDARLLLLVAATAAANGIVEELYWRGLYLREFADNALIGLWIATALFGGWHVSLYLVEGISFHGGFGALVGGATAMGLLWSYASRRLGNVAAATLAHVLVNAFTFTQLYIENGF